MDARQQRGLEIAAKGGLFGEGAAWYVPSQNGHGSLYRVSLAEAWCSCPDHADLRVKCKHIWAAELTVKLELDGQETFSLSYRQEWSSYNRSQVQEKDTFMKLLSELCSGVPQPAQTRGRPRLPLSDMAFAATFKVYSRFSSRRFSSDLREAHERGLIERVPHYNSVSGYMASPSLTPVLQDLIATSSLPLKAVESDFAVDSSGFSTSRFHKWFDQKYGKQAEQREWVKAHLMVGVRTNVVTAVEITGGHGSDTRQFPALLETTTKNFDLSEVSADKAYLSKANLALVEQAGAVPFIPFKTTTKPMLAVQDSPWSRMYYRFMTDRPTFMAHYHKRSNVETAFSMIKAKFGDALLSKSPIGQANEVLCKVLAHNVVVVAGAIHELGIAPEFASATA
jgi:transposase